MLKEILLFMNWLAALIVSIKYFKQQMYFNFNSSLKYLLLLGIVIPIVEESLFRSTLYSLTSHLEYYKLLNAVLFGLVHLTNYFVTHNKKFTLVQTGFAFYMGYYLIDLDNVLMAMLIHSVYNTSMILIVMIYSNFLSSKDKNESVYDPYLNDLVSKTVDPVFYDGKSFRPIRTTYNLNFDRLKKSKSVDDLPKSSTEKIGEFYYVHPLNRTENKTVFHSILPEDIQDSLENYDEAVRLRQRSKYNYNNNNNSINASPYSSIAKPCPIYSCPNDNFLFDKKMN